MKQKDSETEGPATTKPERRLDSPADPKTEWIITVFYKKDLFRAMQEQYYHLVQEKYSASHNIQIVFRTDFVAGQVFLLFVCI